MTFHLYYAIHDTFGVCENALNTHFDHMYVFFFCTVDISLLVTSTDIIVQLCSFTIWRVMGIYWF